MTNLISARFFVCINNRHGKSPSCGHSGSEEIVEDLRKASKELNLKGKLRVARSGCLDLCAFGPNLMIWPEGIWYIWYIKVTKEDVQQIVETYMKLEDAEKAGASDGAAG